MGECMREKSQQLIVILEERKQALVREVKDILASAFWEISTIPLPVIERCPESDMVMDF